MSDWSCRECRGKGMTWNEERKVMVICDCPSGEAKRRYLDVELLLEERIEFFSDRYPAQLTEAARYFRVDLKKLEASVKKEAEEKRATAKLATKTPRSKKARERKK